MLEFFASFIYHILCSRLFDQLINCKVKWHAREIESEREREREKEKKKERERVRERFRFNKFVSTIT